MVAAAGGHHILMSGSPGAGKTMMAQALISILPPPSLEEAVEITKIYSVAGLLKENDFLNFRPYRAPHHTASSIAVIGGGGNPKPGEISLAHRGVLFLDEMPEFRRDLLEALRQPLESGDVRISRVKNSLVFPARFLMVAAMNPCPCGYFSDPEKECRCTANEVFRYQKKISGPLIDRIDIQIEVPRVKTEELMEKSFQDDGGENESEEIKKLVLKARKIQKERFAGKGIGLNSEMDSKTADELIILDKSEQEFLKKPWRNLSFQPGVITGF